MKKTLLAVAVFVALSPVAIAQTANNLNPSTNMREAVLDSTLQLRFEDFNSVLKARLLYAGGNAPGGKYFGFINSAADYLGFFSTNIISFRAPTSTEQLKITSTGVTVGTNAAETAIRLTVNGAIDVKGNIAAKYQDVAEWVPAFGAPKPGTVVVLSEDASNHVVASSTSYDTRVAGVVSHQPGVILGEPAANKVQVATTGRVLVLVDATAAPIKIGDLLVTSDKPGVAMKSIPVDVAGIKMHRPGTVVGKALEPLAGGTGEILVLLSMQ